MMTKGGSIVVLTGAGVSAESGLATFRGADGLWEGHRVQDVATPEAYDRDPATVHRFYNARRRQLQAPEVAPNAAHRALARLEREWPGEVLVVTQNVDDLHERAGQRRLIHMHGELNRARCTGCRGETRWLTDLDPATACPACGAEGGMRPAIVWFGEMPLMMEEIFGELERCDLFAAIGTSGQVYPAAGFVAAAAANGKARTLEINLEPGPASKAFDERMVGPAATLVPEWVDGLLQS